MIYPQFLKKCEKIGVPAPSDGSQNELYFARYKNAKKKLEEKGFKIELSKNIFNSVNGRSGSAKERANEINDMFERKDINAIICLAGGEFLVEILPYIDFEKLAKNPKWIEGFSDPTGILFPLTTKYDIASIYGNNFSAFGAENWHESLKQNLEILQGNLIEQTSFDLYENERQERITGLEGYNLTDRVEWKTYNFEGKKLNGRIIGGCLDIISELAGTKFDGVPNFNEKYKNDGIIWFFDNCELSKEELIRVMWKFNTLGYFKYCKGVIFGRNGIVSGYIYKSMEDMLKDSVLDELKIPIIYDADISHKGPCLTIINGSIAEFEKIEKNKWKVNFKCC